MGEWLEAVAEVVTRRKKREATDEKTGSKGGIATSSRIKRRNLAFDK